MKTTLGGDRLGSGNKQEISLRNYERSTHDLSYTWRNTQSVGTLVPFINELALPADVFEITLNADAKSLPTLGPLFGRFKLQMDVFSTPIYLYNAKLHMNALNVGMDMSSVYLPQLIVRANNHTDYVQTFDDNEHVNPSCLLKYLGISGLGRLTGTTNPALREFNAVPLLCYMDIYKNYYANKQEEYGYFINTSVANQTTALTPISCFVYDSAGKIQGNALGGAVAQPDTGYMVIQYPSNGVETDPSGIECAWDGGAASDQLETLYTTTEWDDSTKQLICSDWSKSDGDTINVTDEAHEALNPEDPIVSVDAFLLSNIDGMREDILQYSGAGAFDIDKDSADPYGSAMESVGAANDETRKYAMQFSQQSLCIKTYQSDLFNNWIDTDWIDGTGGVSELSAVDTSTDEFTIDALNLAKKVYNLLNRIAASGGTYDDWLDAAYAHERSKRIESPMYCGSLIKEIAFQEVISNADTAVDSDNPQPLGTLAGRAALTGKHKGGKIIVKVDEPSVIMGIVSITPIQDVSQGNDWTVNLTTYDDFHKPELDAIGFQDLIAEQLLYTDSSLDTDTGVVTTHSIGKQPAWINYMTNVNKCYGNFADRNKEMFMTLNRRYEANLADGTIEDATTYIDPTKFNHIFAQSSLDSMNYWIQIAVKMIARRKMSAKVIPNL